MYRWFLAYKYVFRLITLAALLGVTYSVFVLLVVVSVMEGFRSELEKRIRETTSDIRVESTIFIGLKDPKRAKDLLVVLAGIDSVTPVVETLALLRRGGPFDNQDAEERLLIALDLDDPTAQREVDGFLRNFEPPKIPASQAGLELLRRIFEEMPRTCGEIFAEKWLRRLRPDDVESLPAIVGSETLRQQMILPGQTFELTSFSPIPPHAPRTRKFFVAGYFKTGLYELDARGIILRLEDADRFLQLTDDSGTLHVSGLRIRVEEGFDSDEELVELRKEIEGRLDDNDYLFVKTQTWREARDSLLQAVKMEKIIVSIILGVVILFAGFMIFIILTVQVVERSRDIGVLQSLGTTPRGIAAIYFIIGCSLCFVGTIMGTIYGVAFAVGINTVQRWIKLVTGYELFPQDIYYLDRIPVSFSWEDLLFIIVPTVAASLLASLLPAFRAATKDPAVSLRYE